MSALLTVNGRKIKINRMGENNQIMPLKFSSGSISSVVVAESDDVMKCEGQKHRSKSSFTNHIHFHPLYIHVSHSEIFVLSTIRQT